eukprot:COSAG02_NODE_5200_length_4546_cov_4.043850_2_plen_99_part_00
MIAGYSSVDCSPNLGCDVELVLAQLITKVEEIEDREHAANGVGTRGKFEGQSPSYSAPSFLSEILSKSGPINTRVLVAVALALKGARDRAFSALVLSI